MTPEEKEISDCLDKVFTYCKKHKNCEGCIFFRKLIIGPVGIAYCKVTYAPEVFGESND